MCCGMRQGTASAFGGSEGEGAQVDFYLQTAQRPIIRIFHRQTPASPSSLPFRRASITSERDGWWRWLSKTAGEFHPVEDGTLLSIRQGIRHYQWCRNR